MSITDSDSNKLETEMDPHPFSESENEEDFEIKTASRPKSKINLQDEVKLQPKCKEIGTENTFKEFKPFKTVKVVGKFRPNYEEIESGKTRKFDQKVEFPEDGKSVFLSKLSPQSNKGSSSPIAFHFDAVYTDNDNETLYNEWGSPMIEGVLNGYHANILAYGDTGTGKTFSTFGKDGKPGLVSYMVEALFNSSEMKNGNIELHLSIFEVADRTVKDLMKCKHQCKCAELKPEIPVCEKTMSKPLETIKCISRALEKRRTESTNLNESGSSRTHAVVKFFLKPVLHQQQQHDDAEFSTKMSYPELLLIDLAGSEPAAAAKNKDQLTDGNSIRTSLFNIQLLLNYHSEKAQKRPAHKRWGKEPIVDILHKRVEKSQTLFLCCAKIKGNYRRTKETMERGENVQSIKSKPIKQTLRNNMKKKGKNYDEKLLEDLKDLKLKLKEAMKKNKEKEMENEELNKQVEQLNERVRDLLKDIENIHIRNELSDGFKKKSMEGEVLEQLALFEDDSKYNENKTLIHLLDSVNGILEVINTFEIIKQFAHPFQKIINSLKNAIKNRNKLFLKYGKRIFSMFLALKNILFEYMEMLPDLKKVLPVNNTSHSDYSTFPRTIFHSLQEGLERLSEFWETKDQSFWNSITKSTNVVEKLEKIEEDILYSENHLSLRILLDILKLIVHFGGGASIPTSDFHEQVQRKFQNEHHSIQNGVSEEILDLLKELKERRDVTCNSIENGAEEKDNNNNAVDSSAPISMEQEEKGMNKKEIIDSKDKSISDKLNCIDLKLNQLIESETKIKEEMKEKFSKFNNESQNNSNNNDNNNNNSNNKYKLSPSETQHIHIIIDEECSVPLQQNYHDIVIGELTKISLKLTNLHIKVLTGNTEDVEYILKTNPGDVNCVDIYGLNAIHYGIMRGQLDIIKMLYDYGVDVNMQTTEAIGDHHIHLFKYLFNENMENNEFINDRGFIQKGSTPLHLCCAFGNEGICYSDILSYLLFETEADPEIKDCKGFTPLHWTGCAGIQRNIEMFTSLNANEADENEYELERIVGLFKQANNDGYTVLHYLVIHNRIDCLTFLLKENKYLIIGILNNVTKENRSSLHYAIEKDRKECFDELLNCETIDVNLKGPNGYPPLHYALKMDKKDYFDEILMCKGIDVNIKGPNYFSVLHYTIENDKKEYFNSLLECEQIDVNLKGPNGFLPLHYAIIEDKKEYFDELLLCEGLNVNLKEESNHFSALHYAIDKDSKEYFDSLLKYNGIDVNLEAGPNGSSPLRYTIEKSKVEYLQGLLKFNEIDVNLKGLDDCSPLHYAIDKDSKECFELLLKHERIDVNLKGPNNCSPLHYAIKNNKKNYLKELLQHEGIDVNLKGPNEFSPLHWAIDCGSKECVQELLKCKDIDVNLKEPYGIPPLHYTILMNREECFRELLKCKETDVNSKDLFSHTPLYYAIENDRTECFMELLLKCKKNDFLDIYDDLLVVANGNEYFENFIRRHKTEMEASQYEQKELYVAENDDNKHSCIEYNETQN